VRNGLTAEQFVRRCVPDAVGVSVKRSEYATSHLIEDVDVECGDRVLKLVLKRLGPGDLLPEAEGKRPEFLADQSREPFVYRSILSRRDLGTARLYGWTRHETGEWLLVERVPGLELFQVGDRGLWEQAARWLARMHLTFAPYAQTTRSNPLVRYDASFYRQWATRAVRFQGDLPSLERLAARWDDVVERLLRLPRTVIHGELYASNVVVVPDTGARDDGSRTSPRICPIDWEMAGVGPGLVDLAALGSGWPEDDRAVLTRAYHDELRCHGAGPGLPELEASLTDCRLLLCAQWLGWAPDWVPPPQQANDWLAEAVALADAKGW
jgi:hypothetical protein